MVKKNIFDRLSFFLVGIIPLSIILGPSISLINIIFVCIITIVALLNENKVYLLKNKTLKLLFLLYFYFIFNSFVSLDYSNGLMRNLGFLRFIILFIGINYFFSNNLKFDTIFIFWISVVCIFTIDVYIERFTGSNIFGWGAVKIDDIRQPDGYRVVSFFKDEPIAGAYLCGFVLLLFGYLLNQNNIYKKFAWIFIFITLIGIFITGERSNSIKIFVSFFLMFTFLDFFNKRVKLLLIVSFFSLIIILLSQSNFLKYRYLSVLSNFQSLEKIQNYKNDSLYFKLYSSGISVFKNYPIFGVGNKNYRVEACDDQSNHQNDNYVCNTHPHQIYIEFLSEHGFVGTSLLIIIFFILFLKIFRNILQTKDKIQLGCLCYLVTIFLPIIPSGSFFTDFNFTIFWINFSIMFAINKKTNIFTNSKESRL